MAKSKFHGFSLIELLVVLVIIGILASIAIPSYKDYVNKARRSDAKNALMSTSLAMERFYTERATYNGATLGNAPADIAKTTSPDSFYTIAFDSAPTSATVCGATADANSSAAAYRLCATPTGPQTGDTCGTMSISQTGVKVPATGCW